MSSRNELEEERDFLLRSLTDLDQERAVGDLDEIDYAVLRDGYTARAAAVLRELEPAPSVAQPVAERAQAGMNGDGQRPRRFRPLATAGLVAVVALGAGAMVARSAGQRLPGDPSSGSIAATGPSSDLQRARLLVSRGETLQAIRLYDKVLESVPDQAEALAYRGWLVLLAGREAATAELVEELTARGLAAIDRAIAADPTYPDAHFFRGLVLFDEKYGRRDPAATVAEMRAFLANGPPPDYVRVAGDVLRRALAEVEGRPVSG